VSWSCHAVRARSRWHRPAPGWLLNWVGGEEGIKDKLPSLLDVNLRDLQEAMRF